MTLQQSLAIILATLASCSPSLAQRECRQDPIPRRADRHLFPLHGGG